MTLAFLEQAATAAEKVDSVFLFILALSAAFLAGITFTMVFFVVRYSRSRNPKPRDIHGHAGLEVAWTLVPLALFLGMFYFGWTNYGYIRNIPRDAMLVKVTGRQWAWEFEYPNGKKTDRLYAALDRPTALEVVSADVIHGFYVPAFRLKIDAVPGKKNFVWFQPTRLGSYDIQCTVICGAGHAYMLSKVVVVEEREFRRWYDGGDDEPPPGPLRTASAAPPAAPEHPGLAVLQARECLACHSLDGAVMVGPTFRELYGSQVTVRSGGVERRAVVDEAYLARAVREPEGDVRRGYPSSMPHVALTDDELRSVIEYLKALR
ncbi:MAG: cytochrome c oxidase subunit II [Planctomycetota bacterium]